MEGKRRFGRTSAAIGEPPAKQRDRQPGGRDIAGEDRRIGQAFGSHSRQRLVPMPGERKEAVPVGGGLFEGETGQFGGAGLGCSARAIGALPSGQTRKTKPLAGTAKLRTPPALIVQRLNRPSEERMIPPVPLAPSSTPVACSGGNRPAILPCDTGSSCPAGRPRAQAGTEKGLFLIAPGSDQLGPMPASTS